MKHTLIYNRVLKSWPSLNNTNVPLKCIFSCLIFTNEVPALLLSKTLAFRICVAVNLFSLSRIEQGWKNVTLRCWLCSFEVLDFNSRATPPVKKSILMAIRITCLACRQLRGFCFHTRLDGSEGMWRHQCFAQGLFNLPLEHKENFPLFFFFLRETLENVPVITIKCWNWFIIKWIAFIRYLQSVPVM